ncbi:class I SAM-dependent methyltransferase [Streptosporangium roseum]|uniref:Methylase involved in ubiquinone/menaquinone biosynthesis-like protein n=1 Tax=Streptosporangium roseum (strain ATCC 12428 / DSM 43021 / JCM 3005 / KCTC 9067 / NCIMB 10171 / NRRL 2505 / NI 9100) TaxID=479432 RepID=D2BAF0_STRRD|nr:class I SAM-dependent methyltransferase [Streptosporangium roseum]ACZ87975.1 Methylase involved in ubiquinone/menaquinone biosynthesis-like protein [Streptosporangium roseum DSM 43021]
MSTISHIYTERDVGDFFDQTLQTYLSFWDGDGVLHTGYFADDADDDYLAAAERTSEVLAAEAKIDGSSRVLDVGCGCGNFMIHLAERFGCRGEGLDLSRERIKFAQEKLAGEKRLDIEFRHGSATQMPYEPGSFSHVVSQDALCLVPDKPRSHTEIHRVLRPGGVFAFSDFLQPKKEIGERARKHVYDRVKWNGGYSLVGYQAALEEAGFEIILARNLESHIRQTYRVLGKTARERAEATPDAAAREWMLAFSTSCEEIQVAIDDGEFGWGLFVTRKRGSAAP